MHSLSTAARLMRGAAVLSITLALGACGGGGDAPTGPPPTTTPPGVPVLLRVSPTQTQVNVGATAQLQASARDANGRTVSGVSVSWQSLDPTVADVVNGVVTGHGAGQARVVASGSGMADTAIVVVTESPTSARSLSLEPDMLTLRPGTTGQLSTTARNAAGAPVTAQTIVWSSDTPDIATVANGVVSAKAVGTARIIARAGLLADTATVTVTDAGGAAGVIARVTLSPKQLQLIPAGTAQLTASLWDAVGTRLSGAFVTWKSTDPEIATISATGVVTGIASGTARMVATANGHADTALVTVTAAPVSQVLVSATFGTLQPGGSGLLAVTVRDALGNALEGRALSFASSNPGVATVSATGLVTAVAVGSTTITVTSEGVSGTRLVQVVATPTNPAPVAQVTVTGSFGPLAVGATGQLSASLRDAAEKVLTGRAVAWTSSDPAVATVSASGLVTAVKVGTATITATSEGKSGTRVVQVVATPVVVGSVTVDPASASLTAGATRQLAATVKDAGGATLTSFTAEWTTSSPGVATVSATGLVTAVGPGTVTITATAGGKSGTATITVSTPTQTRTIVNAEVGAIGSVAGFDGAQFLLPDVLVAGEDDASELSPLQAFATYALTGAPADATVESATLVVTMDPNGVFGDPWMLGPLVAERATTIGLNTAAPGADAVTIATMLQTSVTVDVTALVRAARLAGQTEITFRLRFAEERDDDGETDQLELVVGTLKVTYLK